MKTYAIANLVALAAITLSLIFHIVCLSTPYLASQSIKDVFSALKQAQNESRFQNIGNQILNPNADYSAISGIVHLGLWKVCLEDLHGPDPNTPSVPDTCLTIKGDSAMMSAGDGTNSVLPGAALYSWMKACRALSIIGAIVTALAVILAIIHVVWQSKGDRRRLLPFFLFGVCLFGGTFVLVTNIVFALNYQNMLGGQVPVPPSFSDLVQYVVEKTAHLCWGLALDVFMGVLAYLAGLIFLFAKWREDMGSAGIV